MYDGKWQIRIYTHEQGGFIHCRVFTGPLGHSENCGTLIFFREEMPRIREAMPGVVWIDSNDQHKQREIGN